MKSYEFETYTEAALKFRGDLVLHGKIVSTPRTGEFLELRNICYTVEKCTDRLIPFKSLNQVKLWSYSEVLTEFLGLNPPLTESYTNPETAAFMKTFHRGDGRANYTYGERWHNAQQFQRVLERLALDPYNRQAIMTIWDPYIDLSSTEKNVPCTIMHHFIIRPNIEIGRNVLHTNVYIRSNDFFKGWKYDIFLNSFIHEAFAGFLDCEVGELTFMVGSFHVYKADYSKLDQLHEEKSIADVEQQPKFALKFDELYKQLRNVYYLQNRSRYHTMEYLTEYSIFNIWANAYIKSNIDSRRKE